ncbi:helix-hairpin-helix domain-containing protein [Spongisporangium articulatum]|uniref:Helix-hairpin-helix domain-containing protein n=1 Tax=Spongisporangium articulatum TaxID=3362603 RepID=A0ABW8ATH8_9ACTN
MAWFLGQSLIMLALAFGLGAVVGWVLHSHLYTEPERNGAPRPELTLKPLPRRVPGASGAPKAQSADETAPPDAAENAPAVIDLADESGTEPEAPSDPDSEPDPLAVLIPTQSRSRQRPAPRARVAVQQDNLQRIEGVGPKMAGALNAAGILTFDALARTDVETIEAAIRAAGLRFAPSLATWPEQARLLATGDENGFAQLTATLVSGRRAR